MRVFRNFYLCDECPNEWSTELMTAGPDWCPCCDRETEPYSSDEFELIDEDAE
jgi:hypothetical protein